MTRIINIISKKNLGEVFCLFTCRSAVNCPGPCSSRLPRTPAVRSQPKCRDGGEVRGDGGAGMCLSLSYWAFCKSSNFFFSLSVHLSRGGCVLCRGTHMFCGLSSGAASSHSALSTCLLSCPSAPWASSETFELCSSCLCPLPR